MITILSTSKKHFLNSLGKKLDKKYVVFESDDWGSERIPFKKDLEYLTSCGIDIYSNPFNHLDSLESEDDLAALFETLIRFKDCKGNHPVITSNSVAVNPDYEKIKASGFREYYYESTLETYKNKSGCENSYALIKEGMAAGVYHPQFHGREHLNVQQWLTGLQMGNEIMMKAFNAGIYCIDLDNKITNWAKLLAAFDSSSDQEVADYGKIIEEGLLLFKNTFGYSSDSFIAPCYIWHPSLEIILKSNGIRYLQGLPIQYAPVYNSKYRKIYHYQGERNKMEQTYFIRNCFLEPALNAKFNYLADCLKRISIIFSWGKPAIIGTHRINFIGSINNENRRRNLKILSALLSSILNIWPDVEFTTTDKLGEKYSTINHK
jgi:hypothetical protein